MLKKEGIINDEECTETKMTKDEDVIGTVKFGNANEAGDHFYVKSKSNNENGNKIIIIVWLLL